MPSTTSLGEERRGEGEVGRVVVFGNEMQRRLDWWTVDGGRCDDSFVVLYGFLSFALLKHNGDGGVVRSTYSSASL